MIRRDPRRRSRVGFTMIELLVVIVIIGILMALLLPVIIAAIRKANEAKISAEIQTMAMALAKFKDTYGEYPPSRVVLNEQGNYSLSGGTIPQAADFQTPLNSASITWYGGGPAVIGTPDISFGELAQRSLRALRKFFPKAALGPVEIDGASGITVNDYWPDYNGNAINASAVPDAGMIYLEGHECLVFFLGGIPTATASSKGGINFGASGFCKDPAFPFRNNNSVTPTISSTNRNPAFFEFRGERLIDDDGDGVPGYLDANASSGAGTFYAYFMAYGGTGYDPNDVNSHEADDFGNSLGTFFRTGAPTFPVSAAPTNLANTPFSPAPNPYTTSLPTPITGVGFNANQPASYINQNSFQIICSGGDGLFGMGGEYHSGTGDKLPMPPRPPYTLLGGTAIADGLRDRENDNITSFSSGRLQ